MKYNPSLWEKSPSKGGIPIKILKKKAKKMGINEKLNKKELCLQTTFHLQSSTNTILLSFE